MMQSFLKSSVSDEPSPYVMGDGLQAFKSDVEFLNEIGFNEGYHRALQLAVEVLKNSDGNMDGALRRLEGERDARMRVAHELKVAFLAYCEAAGM